MTQLHNRPVSTADSATTSQRSLPAWPILILFHGFPVIWAMGALQFAPFALAVIMAALMVLRGRLTVPLPAWFLTALVVWALACATQLPDAGALVGFALRWGNLLAALIILLYVVNARDRLGHHAILAGLMTVWATVVLMGTLALFIPEVRLTTPVGMLLPGSLTSNELVKDLVFPPMAEVQLPWGAPEPYIRPSAPFPYANSWGVAYVMLTPVALATLLTVRTWWVKLLICAGLVLSLVPAVGTSNRGMFLGLGIALGYAVFRLTLSGYWKVGLAGLLALTGAVMWMILGGVAEQILGRQEYSDSTGGRLNLYQQTWEASLESPLLGHGAPRLEESVGVYMGTQGYLWFFLFSYGLVGLLLFIGFLWGSTWWTRGVKSPASIMLHSVPLAASAIFVVYSFDIMQTCVLVSVVGLLMRERIAKARS